MIMKNIVKLFITILTLTFLTGCYDREIIDRKDFNYSLPTIDNLSVTQQDGKAILSWQIPSNISDSFNRPLEVSVQVVEDDIYRQRFSVFGEGTGAEVDIDPTKEYRFVVKLLGFLTPEAKMEGFTDRVYSDGVIVEL